MDISGRNPTTPLCGYFGARRKQKGFTLLPWLVAATQNLSPDAHFTIQTYNHRDDKNDLEIERAYRALRKQKNIRLIEETLDSDSFTRELAACDIILIPYDPIVYRKGTSGIFVMAVVSRAVTIVTQGSWMAHVAIEVGLSRVIILPHNAATDQIDHAVAQAFERLNTPDQPSDQERLWCSAQTGDGVWKALAAAPEMKA
jgi:hypothetical protein